METNDSDSKLLLVAEALGDGQPIDWDGLALREPEIAAELHELKRIESVATAYRRGAQTRPPDPVEGTETRTAPTSGGAGPGSRAWIFIAAIAAALLALTIWMTRPAHGALPPGTHPERPRVHPAPRVFDATARMDVNNLDLPTTNYGVVAFQNGAPGGLVYPKGSGLTALFDSGLWIGGKVLGATSVSVAAYFPEFAPGTLSSDPLDARFRSYKLVRGNTTSPDYLGWPVADGAPLDSLGSPYLLGDAMIWHVFNDGDPSRHLESWGASAPLDVEVRQSIFGFSRNGPLNDIIFLRWSLLYRGTAPLDSAYVSLFGDVDLGDYRDDLTGCDTTLALGYCYNAGAADAMYGSNPPAVGLVFLKGPNVPTIGGAADTLGMTAFVADLAGTVFGAEQSFQLMRGFHANGTAIHPFDDPLQPPTSFELSGDPVAGTGWLDGTQRDQKFLMSSGPFQMAAGDSQEIVAALIVGRGGDRLASVEDVRAKVQVARQVYADHFVVPGSPIPSFAAPVQFTIDVRDSLQFDVKVVNAGTASYALQADSVPAGSLFMDNGDNTGTFVWGGDSKPLGTYVLRFTAIGTSGDTLSAQTRIDVENVNRPPQFVPPSDMVVTEGMVATQIVSATDPDEEDHLQFSIVEGPAFVTLETNDSLSAARSTRVRAAPGTPGFGGYRVTLQVADDFFHTAVASFFVTVITVPHPPTLEAPSSVEGTEGQRLTFSCQAHDPDTWETLRITASGIPSSLSLSAPAWAGSTYGTLEGVPVAGDVGVHLIQWSVSDGVLPAVTATTSLTIRARDVGPAPVLLGSSYLAFDIPSVPIAMFSGAWGGDATPRVAVFQQNGLVSYLRSGGPGLFTPHDDEVLGFGGSSVARGDFNADGIADVLVSGYADASIFLGSSSGAFTSGASFRIDGGLAQAAVVDVNGDQRDDVIAVSRTGIVATFLGVGDGTLQSPSRIPLTTAASVLLVQDLDGDGHVDLVIADFERYTISIFPGSGGDFGEGRVQFLTVNTPVALAASDMNGDGRLDLVVLGASSLAVHLGTGRFTYRMANPVPVGGSIYLQSSFAIADANGDGHPDAGVALPRKFSIFYGNGDGGLVPGPTLALPAFSSPHALLWGEFTSDGNTDAAVAMDDGSAGGVLIVLPGPFGAPDRSHEYPTGRDPGHPVVVDLNGDGHADVLVPGPDTLDVFLGDGRARLSRIASITGAAFGLMAQGDFDGDGDPDVAARSWSQSADSSAVSIFWGRGDGTFQRGNDLSVAMSLGSLVSGDWNEDGRADLIVSEYGNLGFEGNRLEAFLSRADGTFESTQSMDLDFQPVLPRTADLNRDGHIDLVFAAVASPPSTSPPPVVSFLGRGDGTFAPGGTHALDGMLLAMSVGDMDSDGIPDVVAGTDWSPIGAPPSITILHGLGDGTWGRREPHEAHPGQDIAVSDFDGDGGLDFAVSYPGWGAVSLHTRRPDGSYVSRGAYGNGGANEIAAGDFNEDGSPDLVVSEGARSRLGLLLNQGPAAPAATTSRAEAEGDVITLAWYLGEGVSGPATVYRAIPAGSWASLRSLAVPSDRVLAFTDSTAVPGQPYRYRLGVWRGGVETFSSEVLLTLPSSTTPPRALALGPGIPNPSRGATTISYALPSAGPVRIRVFDVSGREVAVLKAGTDTAGEHAVVWNGRDRHGRDAGSGIYFVKLDSEGQSRVRKIALTR